MPELIRKHRSKITVGGAVAVLGLVVALMEMGSGRGPGDRVRADARRVHCLDAKQRPGLVQTAIRLGAAAPGSSETAFRPVRNGRVAAPVTLDEWSRESRESFARACGPLAALTYPGGLGKAVYSAVIAPEFKDGT